MNFPTYEDVLAAAPVVHRYMKPTPLYEWPALSQLLGCRYYLKHENHTPTTAFKVRGGLNVVARLPDEQKRQGIIGCTTGNHGQSLAYAARAFGVRCVLVVPTNASGSGSGGSYQGTDFRNAYAPQMTQTGKGETIGIFMLDGFVQSDINAYATQTGQSFLPVQIVGAKTAPAPRRRPRRLSG